MNSGLKRMVDVNDLIKCLHNCLHNLFSIEYYINPITVLDRLGRNVIEGSCTMEDLMTTSIYKLFKQKCSRAYDIFAYDIFLSLTMLSAFKYLVKKKIALKSIKILPNNFGDLMLLKEFVLAGKTRDQDSVYAMLSFIAFISGLTHVINYPVERNINCTVYDLLNVVSPIIHQYYIDKYGKVPIAPHDIISASKRILESVPEGFTTVFIDNLVEEIKKYWRETGYMKRVSNLEIDVNTLPYSLALIIYSGIRGIHITTMEKIVFRLPPRNIGFDALFLRKLRKY